MILGRLLSFGGWEGVFWFFFFRGYHLPKHEIITPERPTHTELEHCRKLTLKNMVSKSSSLHVVNFLGPDWIRPENPHQRRQAEGARRGVKTNRAVAAAKQTEPLRQLAFLFLPTRALLGKARWDQVEQLRHENLAANNLLPPKIVSNQWSGM